KPAGKHDLGTNPDAPSTYYAREGAVTLRLTGDGLIVRQWRHGPAAAAEPEG
ncbi:MAG: hypothetical protein JRI59_04225, partial [Deltaproteobacteria bacterium]|nr:hypothetical protein [Deltaproteobacteria bacterium]